MCWHSHSGHRVALDAMQSSEHHSSGDGVARAIVDNEPNTVGTHTRVSGQPVVLLIASDAAIAEQISRGLAANGFEVHVDTDSIDLDRVIALAPDLILLEQMTTSRPRWPFDAAVLGRPLIVIGQNNLADVCHAFDRGAAEYIGSPQRERELASRLRAVLRRVDGTPKPIAARTDAGDLQVDVGAASATVAGRLVTMSWKDALVLEALVEKAGRVVTYDEIAVQMGGVDYDAAARVITEHVRRIRARIEDDPGHPTRVLTVRGVGYRLVPH